MKNHKKLDTLQRTFWTSSKVKSLISLSVARGEKVQRFVEGLKISANPSESDSDDRRH